MTAIRQHADALILGHSLEAAISAVLLRKRGLQVVWAGAPPKPTFRPGDEQRPHATPALFAFLERLPALQRALNDAGVSTEVSRALQPVGFQVLGEGKRASFTPPTTVLEPAPGLNVAPRFRPIGLGRWEKSHRAALASLEPVAQATRPTFETLSTLLGDKELAHGFLARPVWMPGGEPWLIGILGKRFEELGGRTLQHELRGDVLGFKHGFSSVEIKLPTGEELGARILLVGVDDPAFRHLTPGDTRADRRLKLALERTGSTLWRSTFFVRSRGLPSLLAESALIEGATPLLLERRAAAEGVEELAVFYRLDRAPGAGFIEALKVRLLEFLPFFDRHVVSSEGPTCVAYSTAPTEERQARLGRRVLLARTPTLSLSGPNGGALLAEGLAELAARLAPRERARS